MRLLRPILSLVLVLVTTLLVSCSSPTQAKIPTVYTPEKIAQLQPYREPIALARKNMATLKEFIDAENWVNIRTFIHGPLGGLRQEIASTSNKLLKKDQPVAENLGKELFKHFEIIDVAAKDRNASLVKEQYNEAIKDFDAYLNLIPTA
ncbi:photosystem II protein PsbQ [Geminocystis sp. GBBB08]|uniref:photosystem II protein PsbQ n=1 Tax=Geminocystis sp. GBBB08 TaxID=2604140 RepID=UPI0027E244AB|nr:photosystem II protein PsbQ [Geminocystis sp. GBBB08]MBL1209852.1 photosystem II protein PsbQ [Geminocystis sp. GBBB08]